MKEDLFLSTGVAAGREGGGSHHLLDGRHHLPSRAMQVRFMGLTLRFMLSSDFKSL